MGIVVIQIRQVRDEAVFQHLNHPVKRDLIADELRQQRYRELLLLLR